MKGQRDVPLCFLADPGAGETVRMIAGTDSQRQKEALDNLYAGLNAIDDEPPDEAFDAIMSNRFNIRRKPN
jgi:hypothetical protein